MKRAKIEVGKWYVTNYGIVQITTTTAPWPAWQRASKQRPLGIQGLRVDGSETSTMRPQDVLEPCDEAKLSVARAGLVRKEHEEGLLAAINEHAGTSFSNRLRGAGVSGDVDRLAYALGIPGWDASIIGR